MWDFVRKPLADQTGATAIEYGLIAALIAVAAIGAMSSLGGKLKTTFNGVANNPADIGNCQTLALGAGPARCGLDFELV